MALSEQQLLALMAPSDNAQPIVASDATEYISQRIQYLFFKSTGDVVLTFVDLSGSDVDITFTIANANDTLVCSPKKVKATGTTITGGDIIGFFSEYTND